MNPRSNAAQTRTQQDFRATEAGRLFQGLVVDTAMGLMQTAVRSRDPFLTPIFNPEEEAMQDSAIKAVDQYVNGVDNGYKAARAAAGQDIDGIDYLRTIGNLFSPLPGPKIKVGASLVKKMLHEGTTSAGQSLVASPVNTNERSYGAGKLDAAVMSGGLGAIKPIVLGGAANVIAPRIHPRTGALLEAKTPLTLGETLGGPVQRAENWAARQPEFGAPIRAAQERSLGHSYPGLLGAVQAGAGAKPGLRLSVPSAEINRGLSGLLADAVYSKPGQAVLRTVVSQRPQSAGIIGDYLRGNAGLGATLGKLTQPPRR